MNTVTKCRKCGRPVSVITWGIYRKILVDAEAVKVIADPEGEEFVRHDGSKVRGREATKADWENMTDTEFAFRQHRKTCGVEE